MIASIRELVDSCYEGGGNWETFFRKVPAIATTQGIACDLSMNPGNPRPNYYTGDSLTATLFNTNYGLWHGGNVSPGTKYIHKVLAYATNSEVAPIRMLICDYLMFYPLIDMDSTDEQFLVNTTTLPRYTDGKGVQAFLVATNPFIGGASFFIKYTNQNGVSDRISQYCVSNSTANIGTIVNSGITAGTSNFFIPLLSGDFVRSIQSITFNAPNGGLASLVLVKPLVEFYIRETNAPAEWDFILMQGGKLSQVFDGAYLNFLAQPNGNMAGQYIIGNMNFIWK